MRPGRDFFFWNNHLSVLTSKGISAGVILESGVPTEVEGDQRSETDKTIEVVAKLK